MGVIQHLQATVVELTAQLNAVNGKVQALELQVQSLQPPISEFMAQVRKDCSEMCAEMRATKEMTNSSLALLSRDYAAQQAKLHQVLSGASERSRRQQEEAAAFTREMRERLAAYQAASSGALEEARAASADDARQAAGALGEVRGRQLRLEADFAGVLHSLEHLKAVALPGGADEPWAEQSATRRRVEALELAVRAQAAAEQSRVE